MAGAVQLPRNATQAALALSLMLLMVGIGARFSTQVQGPASPGAALPGQLASARPAHNVEDFERIKSLGKQIENMKQDLIDSQTRLAARLNANSNPSPDIAGEVHRAVMQAIKNVNLDSKSSHEERAPARREARHEPAAERGAPLTGCAATTVPLGLAARLEDEVMKKSKEDTQYGAGIKNKPATGTLVDSAKYWETRYAMGGNSGAGSYNKIGVFKAEVVNNFVKDNDVKVVMEFGFGDGQQLTRAKYPYYIGLDVSKTIFEKTSERFKDDRAKEFRLYDGHTVDGLESDLTLSFDVIYHLVEDQVYYDYMEALFAMSTKYVIVYSSNIDGWHGAAHVLHRNNSKYIAQTFPDWKFQGSLRNRYPEKTAQDFFFYSKCS